MTEGRTDSLSQQTIQSNDYGKDVATLEVKNESLNALFNKMKEGL